jgi:cobalamin biosynthetic protein CobC
LLELARGLAARDGLLVVDEAFADFEPALSLAPTLPHPGLIVLRSFGKAYGLAGLRLGFALTSGPLLAPLRAVLGPWPVCGPAVEVGATALRDAAWRAAAGHRLARDAAALDAVLMAAGLAIVGGTSLFRLARHPRAADILTRLGQRGLLARPFPEHPDWLRFGVPASPEVLARLERALASHAG